MGHPSGFYNLNKLGIVLLNFGHSFVFDVLIVWNGLTDEVFMLSYLLELSGQWTIFSSLIMCIHGDNFFISHFIFVLEYATSRLL